MSDTPRTDAIDDKINKHRLRDETHAAIYRAELQRVERELTATKAEVEALEAALETLVNRCNHDFALAADPAVIAAEAALERLYRARAALTKEKA
jgi:hypothetical protein